MIPTNKKLRELETRIEKTCELEDGSVSIIKTNSTHQIAIKESVKVLPEEFDIESYVNGVALGCEIEKERTKEIIADLYD
jgi:hypothetical protein